MIIHQRFRVANLQSIGQNLQLGQRAQAAQLLQHVQEHISQSDFIAGSILSTCRRSVTSLLCSDERGSKHMMPLTGYFFHKGSCRPQELASAQAEAAQAARVVKEATKAAAEAETGARKAAMAAEAHRATAADLRQRLASLQAAAKVGGASGTCRQQTTLCIFHAQDSGFLCCKSAVQLLTLCRL